MWRYWCSLALRQLLAQSALQIQPITIEATIASTMEPSSGTTDRKPLRRWLDVMERVMACSKRVLLVSCEADMEGSGVNSRSEGAHAHQTSPSSLSSSVVLLRHRMVYPTSEVVSLCVVADTTAGVDVSACEHG